MTKQDPLFRYGMAYRYQMADEAERIYQKLRRTDPIRAAQFRSIASYFLVWRPLVEPPPVIEANARRFANWCVQTGKTPRP